MFTISKKNRYKYLVIPFVLALMILLSTNLKAQDNKIGIWIDDSQVQERVGRNFVYKFKEEIRKSSAYRLLYTSPTDEKGFIVNVATMDPDDNSGNRAAFSISWILYDPADSGIYRWHVMDGTMAIYGSLKIEELAENIMARTDKNIQQLLDFLAKAAKNR